MAKTEILRWTAPAGAVGVAEEAAAGGVDRWSHPRYKGEPLPQYFAEDQIGSRLHILQYRQADII